MLRKQILVCGYMQKQTKQTRILILLSDTDVYHIGFPFNVIHKSKPLSRSVQENGVRWHSMMVLVFSSQIMVCSHNIAYTPFYQNNLPENTEHDISKSLPVCLFCA